MYETKKIKIDYVLLTGIMVANTFILPAEKALMESLTTEQMVLVAKWISSEMELRKKDDYHPHVSESLRAMAHRIRSLAQQN
jgi:hypothetical protein